MHSAMQYLPGSYQGQSRPDSKHRSSILFQEKSSLLCQHPYVTLVNNALMPISYLYARMLFCTPRALMQLVICSFCHTVYTLVIVNTFQYQNSLGRIILTPNLLVYCRPYVLFLSAEFCNFSSTTTHFKLSSRQRL